MNLLRKKHDDQVLNDDVLDETELDSASLEDLHTAGLGRRTRLGISLVTMGLVVVVLVMAQSRWLPSAQSAWTRIFPPPPYTGALLYAHTGASLYGLRATDGKVQWATHAINSDTNVIVHGDTIITISADAQLPHSIVALRASDGHVLWQTATTASYTRPVLFQDAQQIYAWYPLDTGPAKQLYEAIDPQNGHIRWSIHMDGFPLNTQQSSADILPFCIRNTNTANGIASNMIIAVERKTGAERWRSPTLTTSSAQGSPCYVAGDTVLMNLEQPAGSQTIAYDIHTGAQRWQMAYQGKVATVDQNAIYVTTWDINLPSSAANTDTFTAWRAIDGQRLWQINGSLGIPYSTVDLPMSHASLLTITPTGLAGIDPLSGAIKWQRTLYTDSIINLPILYGAGDVIYYVDGADIYALHSTTGAVIWHNMLPAALQYGLIVQLYADHGSVYGLSQLALTAFDGANGHILWNNTQSFSDLICGSCG